MRPRGETSAYYFSCSGGPDAVSIKSTLGHVTPTMRFLHPLGSAGHEVHFGASGARKLNALFFMLGWARCGLQKSVMGHVTP
jgi:hypothetical protein